MRPGWTNHLTQSLGKTNIALPFCTEPALFSIPGDILAGDVLEMIPAFTASTAVSLSNDISVSSDLKPPVFLKFFLAAFNLYILKLLDPKAWHSSSSDHHR
jgi:hypothetical protein